MPPKDLREFISRIENVGELRWIETEIDPRYEIGALGRRLCTERGPAVVLSNVKGYSGKVAMHVFGTTFSRMALAMDVQPHDMIRSFCEKSKNLVKSRLIDEAPCQENVIAGPDVDLSTIIPRIIWNSGDGGPYITFGLFINKDGDTGRVNMAIYRLMMLAKNRLGVFLQPPQHAAVAFLKAEERGKPLEVAIAIGGSPLLYLASQVPLPYGSSEIELAGSLQGEPVDVVRCKTVDLEVPACAEIVIEGRVLPKLRHMEGPFGEFTGYLSPQVERPVIEVSAITHREDPFYLCTYEGFPPTEDHTIHAITKSAAIFQQIRDFSAPTIRDAHFPLGGCAAFHAVVSIVKQREGQAKNVILDILKNHLIKSCIVVDEDIDVRDSNQVEWAVATRVQPDKDILIISDMVGPHLDPLAREGQTNSKYGIDATKPLNRSFPLTVTPDQRAMDRIGEKWEFMLAQKNRR